jgi:GDP-4-dehydro-6-deoxy-D-mannose reductase
MARILVTGARGFIARALAPALVARGHEIIGIERAADPRPVQGMHRVLAADLLDPVETTRGITAADPTIVVHLAARGVGMAGARGPKPGIDDLAMTANLLGVIDRAPSVRHVIFASSAAVYGPSGAPISESAAVLPTSDYGISKAAAERLVQGFANATRTATVLRFGNVVGAGERRPSVVSSVCRQIAEVELGRASATIMHGRLDESRDFVDVADVARAIALCCDFDSSGSLAYNVGSGRAVAISKVVATLASLARRPVTLELDPDRVRPGPATSVALDSSALRARVGWRPEVPLATSLADTLEFWRAEVRR